MKMITNNRKNYIFYNKEDIVMRKILTRIEMIPNVVLRNIVETLFIMLVNPLSITIYLMFICEMIYKYLL